MVDMTTKAGRVKSLKREQVKRALKEAAKKGRRGDDRLVHVNAQEEQMLKDAGGAGSVNPETGLREYGPHQGGYGGGQGGMGGGGNAGGGQRGADKGLSQRRDRNLRDLKDLQDRGWAPDRPAGDAKNVGGMPPSLLDSKYPGARNKKVKSRDFNWDNALKLGGTVASMLGGPIGMAANAAVTGIDAALSGDFNPMDPYSGARPDVPSTGAGYAQGSDRALGPAIEASAKKSAAKRISQPKRKMFGVTLLQGSGGVLTGS